MSDEEKPSLLKEKLEAEEAKIAASTSLSVGDVFGGRTIVGVRTVEGKTFVSFGGNVWEAA